MSEGCNMNCSYCFEKDKNKKYINKETIDNSINFLFSNKENNYYNITFFGGEPTINPKMIDYTTNKILEICI
jgi:uncharacterized protein